VETSLRLWEEKEDDEDRRKFHFGLGDRKAVETLHSVGMEGRVTQIK
jgi:hypothetical protein